MPGKTRAEDHPTRQIDSYERLGDLDNEETVSTHGDETAQAHDAEQEAKLREGESVSEMRDIGGALTGSFGSSSLLPLRR